MNNNFGLIYEGKAKKIYTHPDKNKVIIEFKDDATAFNARKKATFEGKGKLNCQISSKIFELLNKNDIPTHYVGLKDEKSIIAKKIKIIPLEIVLRNTAYGSLCKETLIKPGTVLGKPLIDIYFKNDDLGDPLLTKDRIALLKIIDTNNLQLIEDLTLKINKILKNFFSKINIDLIDFKLEFGFNNNGEILLGDEISPDNCRLWDLKQENGTIVSLDKDIFRNDLGGLIDGYSEINKRIIDFI